MSTSDLACPNDTISSQKRSRSTCIKSSSSGIPLIRDFAVEISYGAYCSIIYTSCMLALLDTLWSGAKESSACSEELSSLDMQQIVEI